MTMIPENLHQTREHILRAAEEVVTDVGMRNATTRAIAQRAGCAEGSIYRYFTDKHALFLEVAKRRFPTFIDLVATFPERAGTSTVERNLREMIEAAMEFFRAIIPMTCGIMAEHGLLHQQRRNFKESHSGPMKVFGEIEEYVRREQGLGRISIEVSPPHVARLLVGACFGQAFLTEMIGHDAEIEPDEGYARNVVRVALTGMAPPSARAEQPTR
jgi:AcrR family transcriptional regulator